MKLLIRYRDVSGEVTDREISEILGSPYGGAIDAFCHLRTERRTFALARIISAVDTETGEVLEDLSQLCPSFRGTYWPVADDIVTAVMALKFFSLQVRRKRGFDQKERQKIIDFIERNDKDGLLKGDIEGWLKNLWVGDIFDCEDKTYQRNLENIPAGLRMECRAAAIRIASGSGRVLPTDQLVERVNWEYPLDRSGVQMPGLTISRAY